MWLTCTLLTAMSLAPGQAAVLDINNIRVTQGVFGAVRTETKYKPGDRFLVSYDIENLTKDENGRVLYTMAMELIDNATKKVIFADGPHNLEGVLALGGGKLPAVAHAEIGTDTPVGSYTLKVLVADRAGAKATKSFTKEFSVEAKGFAVVRPQLTTSDGIPSPSTFTVGQVAVANCTAVLFERDKAKNNPNVTVQWQVKDDKNTPTVAKPFTRNFNTLPANQSYLEIFVPVDLNREGVFTLELLVTDEVSKKTDKMTVPLKVLKSE